MAPVGPLTLLHNGSRHTNRCCRLHALCNSASSSCSSHTASAPPQWARLCTCESGRTRAPRAATGANALRACLAGIAWRHAHASHAVQPARHETRLGNLARDHPILPAELDFGHPLCDFGQPSVLHLALSRCSFPVSVDAQDACVRDVPYADLPSLTRPMPF